MNASWQEMRLEEVAELRGRIGWKGLTAKEYTAEGPLFISVHSLNHGQFVDARDAFHISQHRYDESPEIMLRENDVLICKDGAGIGKVAILPCLTEQATINSSLLLIRPSELIAPKFLYYTLLSPYFQRILISKLNGATTPHLYQRDLANFPVYVPALKEQERIVAILDRSLEGCKKLLDGIAEERTLLQLMLDGFMDSIFRNLDSNCEELLLPEIATEYGRGKSKHRPRNDPKLYGGPYPFIQTGDVRNAGQFVSSHSQTYNAMGLSQSKLWPKGTLCITIAANIAETAILDFPACFPDSIVGVVVDPKKTSTAFLEYQLRLAKAQLQARGKGSAQDNINLSTFETHPFKFPALSVQENLVEKLNGFSDRIEQLLGTLDSKRRLIEELKQSLLHQAFSGNL